MSSQLGGTKVEGPHMTVRGPVLVLKGHREVKGPMEGKELTEVKLNFIC